MLTAKDSTAGMDDHDHGRRIPEAHGSVIALMLESAKAMLLLNGGAIVALLAFVGQASDRVSLAAASIRPFSAFLSGIVFASMALISTYLAEASDRETGGRSQLAGPTRKAAELSLILSFIAFGVGAGLALAVLAGGQESN